MDTPQLIPYTRDTALTNFMPLPRSVFSLGLPSTAIALYALLLDRGSLSLRSKYYDAGGWLFVIYTIEHLMESLQLSDRAVKNHLNTLEARGLIRRKRTVKNGPNHIYLYIPADSATGTDAGRELPGKMQKSSPPAGSKVPPNKQRSKQNYNYYQYREEESL